MRFTFSSRQGFTMVELMVVVAIFLIITSVVFLDAPRFRDSSAIDLIAQDIASSIKLAQTYGIGSAVNPGEKPAYGIRFERGSSEFYIFQSPDDESDRLFYDDDFISEQTFRLSGGIINSLCIDRGGNTDCDVDVLDIAFRRPYPEAFFCASEECVGTDIAAARIILTSNRINATREIIVHKNGQIEVRQDEN